MSGTRKRKRHSFTDPSSIRPADPPDTQPRRTLQRASKDRAYAERLAAAGDTIASFNGSAIDNRDAHKRSGRSRKSDAKSAFRVKSSRSIKTESIPPGWPFVDASRSNKSRESRSKEKQSVCAMQSSGNCSRSQSIREIEGNDLPVLTRRQSNVLLSSQDGGLNEQKQSVYVSSRSNGAVSSGASETKSGKSNIAESKQSKQSPKSKCWTCIKCTMSNSNRCKKCKVCGSSPGDASSGCSSVNNSSDRSESINSRLETSTENSPGADADTSKTHSEGTSDTSNTESTFTNEQSKKSATKSSPLKAKTWTCTRCTLTNSNRRKKCQVCGNIRHLSMTSDGTFVLGDESASVLSGKSVSSAQGSAVSDAEEFKSSKMSQIGESDHAASPPEEDLFAIASEPVSTRSRFKQQHLSQGMTQPDGEMPGSQQSSSTNCFQNDSAPSENEHMSSGYSDSKKSSSFLKHVRDYRKGRKDRERAKRAKRHLRHTGNVKVRVRLSLEGVDLDAEFDTSLSAYVPAEIMSMVHDKNGNAEDSGNPPAVGGATIEASDESTSRQVEVRVHVSLEGVDVEPHKKLTAYVPSEIMSAGSRNHVQDVEIDASNALAETHRDNPKVEVRGDFNQQNDAQYELVESAARDTIDSTHDSVEVTAIRCNDGGNNSSEYDSTELALAEVELDAAEVLSRMATCCDDRESSPTNVCSNEQVIESAIEHIPNSSPCRQDSDKAEENIDKQVVLQTKPEFDQVLSDATESMLSTTNNGEVDCLDLEPRQRDCAPPPEANNEARDVQVDTDATADNMSIVDKAHTLVDCDQSQANVSSAAPDETTISDSNQQKEAFVELSYIPMTQQMSEFDYFSQTSRESSYFLEQKAAASQPENHCVANETKPIACMKKQQPQNNANQLNSSNCNHYTDHEASVDPIKLPSNTSDVPLFQTAGKKTTIEVSEESILKASKLFDDAKKPASHSDGESTLDVPFSQALHHQSSESINYTKPPPYGIAHTMFQTAGKGTAIEICEESLSKAIELFNSNKFGAETAANYRSMDPVSASTLVSCVAGNIDSQQTVQHSYLEPSSKLTFPTFQTAGRGTSINVSTEALLKASKLLDKPVSSSKLDNHSVASHAPNNGVRGASSQVKLPPRKLPMFQTAGKKATIQVSDEGLSKANKLFDCAEAKNVMSTGTAKDDAHDDIDTSRENKQLAKVDDSTKSIPMFQTAGKKAPIKVSEESLSKANRLFDSNETRDKSTHSTKARLSRSPSNSRPSSSPMFQSADNARLSCVGQIFDYDIDEGSGVDYEAAAYSENAIAPDVIPTKQQASAEAAVALPIAGKESIKEAFEESLSKTNDSHRGAVVGGFNIRSTTDSTSVNVQEVDHQNTFQTAGKKAPIKVSDEALSKVEMLFGNDISSGAARDSTLDNPAVANIEQPTKSTNRQVKPSLFGFQTAGKKATIKVSDESFAKVSKLFDNFDSKTEMCQPAASYESVSIKETNNPAQMSTLPMFQTAGKKAAINVSQEILSKVETLFDNDSASLLVSCDGKRQYPNQTPDVNAKLTPPQASFGSTKPSNPSAFPMFQTAGKKMAIEVSEESLSNAKGLFNGDVDQALDKSLAKPSNSNHGVNSAANLAEPASNLPCLSVFQTAGKKTAIQISDGSLSEMSRLFAETSSNTGIGTGTTEEVSVVASCHGSIEKLTTTTAPKANVPSFPMFQTAGKKTAIKVSEESLSHASQLFDYVESSSKTCMASSSLGAHLANSSMVPADESKHLGDGEDLEPSAESASPSIDQSILRQRNGNSRKRNRVRFSFDPADLCAVNQAGICQAKEPKHCTLKEPGSFVTPDGRLSYPLMKGHATDNDSADDLSPTNRLESSSIYTPMHHTNENCDMQSEIKSKRLFGSATEGKSEADTPPVKPRVQRWSAVVDLKGCNKVGLGRFSFHQPTRLKCLENGVSDATLRITSTNANKLRFSAGDGSPLFIVGQRDVPKGSNVGKVADIKNWLLEQGCDESLFTEKWIQNHFRMIVWKLAAMEKSFSDDLGGQYLIYGHVLKQLKERYEKELRLARRPAVRKLLNRDISACMPVILCVSQILRFRSKTDKPGVSKEEVRLELTDGWYALPATVDSVLMQFIEKQKVKVGTKLMICNGSLLGSDDGVDPLDDSYSSSKRDCPLCLSINANSTRLARWDAKLGFVSPKHPKLDGGSLIVKSLVDVFVDGGPIPAIDLIICKRYPKMYLEEVNGQSLHLTEAEDAARQIEYNTRHQRASEKIADLAQKECIEELDDDAPLQWKEMQHSNSPGEYYEKLEAFERKLVDDWTHKRAVLLQSMVSRSIEDSMKDDPSTERKSKSYVKVLVMAFSSHNEHSNGTQTAKQTAELTIWRVSDDQFELFKEGSVVRMRNVVVKSKSKRGMLQLSANCETPMEALLNQPNPEQLVQSGYSGRAPKSFIHINILAKQQVGAKSVVDHEFDVVACVVKVLKATDNTTILYLTDESGLIIKVKRDHKAENSDPFSLGHASLPAVVAFCNLRVSSFDEIEHCAVATWELLSCKSNRSMHDRCDELQLWITSEDGVKSCSTVLDKINAGIPFGTDHFIKTKVCFGYILGLDRQNASPSSGSSILIDYGGDAVKVWLPMHLVQQAIQLFEKDCTSDIPLLTGLTLLNYLMCCNQKLLRFVLKEASSYGGESPLLEVIGLSLAKVDELTRLYL